MSTPFQIPVADGLMVLMHEELANKEVTIEDEDCGLVIAAVIRSNLHLHPLRVLRWAEACYCKHLKCRFFIIILWRVLLRGHSLM